MGLQLHGRHRRRQRNLERHEHQLVERQRCRLDQRRHGRNSASAAPLANPYTVTLSGSLSAGGLVFQNQAYTLAGSSGTLNLTGAAPVITVNASSGGTIGLIVNGSTGLTTAGSGTLTFTGTNVYTGTTTIASGVVSFTGGAASSGGGALNVGNSAAGINSGTAVLNLSTTGTTAFGNPTIIGNPGFSGAINLTTGTFNDNPGGGYIAVGGNGSGIGGYGSLNITGGTLNINGTSGIRVGDQGMGSFTQTGGVLNSSRYFVVGFQSSGVGVATVTGGSTTVTTSYRTIIGNNGLFAAGTLNIGTEAGGNGLFTTQVEMSNSGSASSTLNLNSGTLALTNGNLNSTTGMTMTNTNSATGILNLNGGVIAESVNNLTLITNALTAVNVYKGVGEFQFGGQLRHRRGELAASRWEWSLPGERRGVGLDRWRWKRIHRRTPLVGVTGGSGSGAMAVANISNGVVTGVAITNPGQNYQVGDVLVFSFSGGGYSSPANSYSYTLTANDVASNAGGVTKSGAGALYLTGAGSTYAGPTNVTAGTLALGPSVTLPSTTSLSATGAVNLNSASQTINSLSGPSTGVVNLNATALTVANGGNFAGAILDNGAGGSLIVNGGLLALSGSSSFTGGTTVSAGTLQLGAGGSTGSLGAGNIVNNSWLSFNRGDTASATALVVPGNISGSGALAMNGTGAAVTLTGYNSYSGPTYVNAWHV